MSASHCRPLRYPYPIMPVLATSFPDETHTYRLATAYDAIDNVTAKSQAATFASPSLPYPHPILFELT